MQEQTNEEPKRYQCRHIFTDGRRCGSPCLRGEAFCYYHHTTRRRIENPRQRRARQSHFDLPLPEDRSAIQSAIGQVLQRIAANEIDPKRAGLLLYGLQIASLNLPREAAPTHKSSREAEAAPVEEIVADPIYGPLAPAAELAEPERRSIVRILLENLREARANEPKEPYETTESDQTTESDEFTEPGSRQPAPSLSQVPALEDVGEPPQNSNPTPEVIPQIQACATASPQKHTPRLCRSMGDLQSPPKDGQRIRHLPLCLTGSVKRKAGDGRAVRNGLCPRKPDRKPDFESTRAGITGPSA